MGDDFGTRMKRFEQVSDSVLIPRQPLMIRLDGKGFSKYTKGLQKPIDEGLRLCMQYAAYELLKEIEGCRFAYVQSDEISLILVDYATKESQPWFNYRLNKVLSIATSICTGAFIKASLMHLPEHVKKRGFAKFDARAWNLPKEEVCNAILWRQQDATRNGIQSLGRSNFSHKQMHQKSGSDIQEMLFQEKGINYNDELAFFKRGYALFKVNRYLADKAGEQSVRKKIVSDLNMPILSQDRNYVENWLKDEPDYDICVEGCAFIEDIDLKDILK